MEKLDDMEIENEDLRNLIQSARRRFSKAYTIFQIERWILWKIIPGYFLKSLNNAMIC